MNGPLDEPLPVYKPKDEFVLHNHLLILAEKLEFLIYEVLELY